MQRQDLIYSLSKFCKAHFVTRKKLADYFGMKDPRGIDQYLDGIDRISGKYYFVNDVVDKILADRDFGAR